MKFDFTIDEINILNDALEDCLNKVIHSTRKIQTSRKYRNMLRRLKERVECALIITDKRAETQHPRR